MSQKRKYKLYLEPSSSGDMPRSTQTRRKCSAQNSVCEAEKAGQEHLSVVSPHPEESVTGPCSNKSTNLNLSLDLINKGFGSTTTERGCIIGSSDIAYVIDTQDSYVENIAKMAERTTDSFESLQDYDCKTTEMDCINGFPDNFSVNNRENSNVECVSQKTEGTIYSSMSLEEQAEAYQQPPPFNNSSCSTSCNSLNNINDVSDTFNDTGNEHNHKHSELFDQNFDDMNELFNESSDLRKWDAIILILSFVIRHSLTDLALDDLLHLINLLFGKTVVPQSLFLFHKLFQGQLRSIKAHFFCKNCHNFLTTIKGKAAPRNEFCQKCSMENNLGDMNDSNYYLTLSIRRQFKMKVQDPNFAQLLNYRETRMKTNNDAYEDIFDGEKYKLLSALGQPLSSRSNYSYIFSTDGFPVFKSSSYAIWPIFAMINELPPKDRAKHMMLCGLWFGVKSPDMNLFLKQFVSESNSLITKGINWQNNGIKKNSKLVATCCCVDAIARAKVQNMKQFNGYYGCGWCLHPGALVTVSNKPVIRYTVSEEEFEKRTENNMFLDMRTAFLSGKPVHGIKGPSVLLNVPYFDNVAGFVVDYMHCCLLGVIRYITEIWLTQTNHPSYIGSNQTREQIDERLKKICPPASITSRNPRSVQFWKYWKATEWRLWLLYYVFPCLSGILPVKYLKHVAFLSTAIFILLSNSITKEKINEADLLLLQFVCEFQILYGKEHMVYNVHCLLHLAESVKNWGPLWAHSSFAFESENGSLLKLIKGARGIPMQVLRKFTLSAAILLSEGGTYRLNLKTKDFLNSLQRKKNSRYSLTVGEVTLLGKGSQYILSDEENAEFHAFASNSELFPEMFLTFKRIIFHSTFYHSKSYSKAVKSNDTVVQFIDGTYGVIIRFLAVKLKCVECVKKCHCEQEPFEMILFYQPLILQENVFLNCNLIPYMNAATFTPNSELNIRKIVDIKEKVIHIMSNMKNYVAYFPSMFEN